MYWNSILLRSAMRKASFRVMEKKSIKRWPVFTVFSLFHGSNIVKYWQCWRVAFCLVISLCAVLKSLRTGPLLQVRQSWRGRVLARWRLRCNKSFPELTQVNLLLRLYYSNAWNSALAHFKMPPFFFVRTILRETVEKETILMTSHLRSALWAERWSDTPDLNWKK